MEYNGSPLLIGCYDQKSLGREREGEEEECLISLMEECFNGDG